MRAPVQPVVHRSSWGQAAEPEPLVVAGAASFLAAGLLSDDELEESELDDEPAGIDEDVPERLSVL